MSDETRRDATAHEAPRDAARAADAGPTAPSPAAPGEGLISIDDFGRLALRVARVVACDRHPSADRLLRLQVDLGGEQRQIVAGIASAYEPEALVGRTVVIVANLKPARLRGEVSQGMLLAATGPDGQPKILTVEGEIPPGAKVS